MTFDDVTTDPDADAPQLIPEQLAAERRTRRLEAQRAYGKSALGRETFRRYRTSAKGRASRLRMKASQRAARKAAGLCRSCLTPTAPTSSILCSAHLAKARAANAASKARAKAAQALVVPA